MLRYHEALYGVAKFGPVKHCVASSGIIRNGEVLRSIARKGEPKRAKALFWQGGVEQSEVHYAELSLRSGIVWRRIEGSGFARLRAVGQALVS